MNNIKDFPLTLPINTLAKNTAQRFASQQSSPEAAEQVRRNTICIFVMCNYLEMMGIPTNLEASDSWHPVVRLCGDVAELEIVGVGKLECRSLRAGESTCYVPPEVWEDRIGYTVLRLEEDGRSATILGFVKKVSTEYLALDRLEPIENLCEAIAALRPKPIKIIDWFQGLFDSVWLELETLLVNPQPQFAWKSANRSTISNPSSNQTIHRITGRVINTTEPTKVEWESNLYWWFLKGQVVANITKTYFNPFTGELQYVNLPPLINWKDALVPTINSASYVGKDGEINTVIAPIYRMKNDTLVVKMKVTERDVRQSIKIVLVHNKFVYLCYFFRVFYLLVILSIH
jgi:hypothetical protein